MKDYFEQETVVLKPIQSIIEVIPLTKYSDFIKAGVNEDGTDKMELVRYPLENAMVYVKASIMVDNELECETTYLSESGIMFKALTKNEIVNVTSWMDKFIYPKELCVYIRNYPPEGYDGRES